MTQLTEEKRWITVNGQHVQIDDDGTVVSSGPLKGTKLGKGGDKPAAKDSGDKQGQSAKPAAKKPHVTETPAFKKWFGDSKVVDKDGKPLVVYHGTGTAFDTFRNTGIGEFGPAIYFSDDPADASEYAARSDGAHQVKPVYVRMLNPFVGTADEFWSKFSGGKDDADTIEIAKSQGYDGIVSRRPRTRFNNRTNRVEQLDGYWTHVIAFSPTQIKSATGNKGTFDPTNPDIRESYKSQVDLEQLRTNAEAKLEKLLAKLDERHKKQLRAAIKQYGWNVPDEVWQAIQQDQENEELAAAILLLFTAADDWTTDAIKQQDVVARGYSRRQFMTYAFDAQRTVQDLAAQTTDTLRKRITRKVQDAQLTGPGDVGEITDEGIDATLDDVFTPERRKGIATDQTTGAFSKGQTAAAERINASKPTIGDDGAAANAGQRVTIQMVWRTERDNLVCFPAGTMVTSHRGNVPIERIRRGDLVLTRDGFKPVVGALRREYDGRLVTIIADDRAITCTPEHLVWTLEEEWLAASELNPGFTLNTVEDESRNVTAVYHLDITEPHNVPTTPLKELGFPGIAGGVIVPVDAIDLNGDLRREDSEVHGITPNAMLLDSGYATAGQGRSNDGFRESFGLRAAITGKATKLLCDIAGAFPKSLIACFAVNPYRRASAFLRAVFTVDMRPKIVLKYLPASLANYIWPSASPAFNATGDIAIGNTSPDGKCLIANVACLRNEGGVLQATGTRAAFVTSDRSSVWRQIKHNIANFASAINTKAESLGRCVLHFLKRKRHDQLYHDWTYVYDIQVAEKPEFFANGILVHNCPRCAPLEGQPEEVWGVVFPNGPGPDSHPHCRCYLEPRIVVEPGGE